MYTDTYNLLISVRRIYKKGKWNLRNKSDVWVNNTEKIKGRSDHACVKQSEFLPDIKPSSKLGQVEVINMTGYLSVLSLQSQPVLHPVKATKTPKIMIACQGEIFSYKYTLLVFIQSNEISPWERFLQTQFLAITVLTIMSVCHFCYIENSQMSESRCLKITPFL